MVAMVNKHLLPLQFQVPILGETVFLTHGLKYNLEMLLFCTSSRILMFLRKAVLLVLIFSILCAGGPWAPFENSWHLRADYKKVSKRKELAQALSKRILWIGIANFALSPIIFLWQILYSFFNYAEVVLGVISHAILQLRILRPNWFFCFFLRLLNENQAHWEPEGGLFMADYFSDTSMNWNTSSTPDYQEHTDQLQNT
jgi:hypothetical protein